MPDFWSNGTVFFRPNTTMAKMYLKTCLIVRNFWRSAFSHHFCVSGWLKQGELRAFFSGIINSTQDSLQICLILNLEANGPFRVFRCRLNVAGTRFFGGFIYQTTFWRKSKEFWEKSSFFMTFFLKEVMLTWHTQVEFVNSITACCYRE